MKLIIAGSRGLTDYSLLRSAIIQSGLWKKYKKTIEVVSGMAKGVDALGMQFAESNGLVLHKFPADWNTYGKRAGIIRNSEMADFADSLLALWDGQSPGTKHMIEYARRKGLDVYAYECHTMWTLEKLE